MKRPTLYIVGCGGHGRVLLDIFRSTRGGRRPPIAFLDDSSDRTEKTVDGAPIAGDTSRLRAGDGVLLGVGDNIARRNLYSRLKRAGCRFPILVAPSAVVSPRSSFGEGAVILAGAVVQTGAHVGPAAIINTAAVVEHDCTVGSCSQLAPRVALSGNVRVGEGSLIGTGASVNKGVTIGEYCLISPGLAVIRDVPDHVVCKLNPAGHVVERNYRLAELDAVAQALS